MTRSKNTHYNDVSDDLQCNLQSQCIPTQSLNRVLGGTLYINSFILMEE